MTSQYIDGLSENNEQYYEKYQQYLDQVGCNTDGYEIYLEQNDQDFKIEYEGDPLANNNIHQTQYTHISALMEDLENQQLHQFNSNICACYNQDKKLLLQEQVHHKVQIKNGIGINTKTINYINIENQSQRIYFLTQVPKDVTVIQISAILGNSQFKSVIKQKENGIEQQQQQIYEDFSDIINIFLGQVEPYQKIQVIYEYAKTLNVKFNQLWIIQINPLLEKYSETQLIYLQQYFQYDNNNRNQYNLKIDIEFDKTLLFYQSPTHQINVQTIGENKIINCNLTNQDSISPFILLFEFYEQHEPQLLLTHFQKQKQGQLNYCATIKILPKLHQLNSNEAYNAYQENNDIDNQQFNQNAKGEYIFILDRSQSMEGPRLEKAKQALILFLKSLPLDSYYNIVSFGYNFLYHYSKTARYQENLINQSIDLINRYTANYGGTNISLAIQVALKLKRFKGYNRNIFLLTDGESDSEPVLEQIELHSKPDVRFYAICIGKECNQYLMEKIAFLGNGLWGIIDDNANLNSVVIQMLKDSIIPWYQNFKISSNIPDNQIQMIYAQIQKVNVMQKNNPIFLQILFNLGEDDEQENYFKITYQDQNKEEQVIQIPIDKANSIESEIMHKVAIKQEMQKIQEFARMQEDKFDNLSDKQNIITKSQMIDLSLNYQVVTPLTTIQSEMVNEQKQENQIEVNQNKEVQELKKPLEDLFTLILQQKAQKDIQQGIKEDIQKDIQKDQQRNNTSWFEAKKSKLNDIISYFHYSGYFEKDVLGILKLNLQEFGILDILESKCQQTIIVLKVLQTYFNQLKKEWEQIYIKALNYLQQQYVDYQNIKDQITIPQLDFGTNTQIQNDQYNEEDSIKYVDTFIQFKRNSLLKNKQVQVKLQKPLEIEAQVDPFEQFIKSSKQNQLNNKHQLIESQNNHQTTVLKASRMKQILGTYKGVGQIDQSLLIIVEQERESLTQGNNLANQLCILFIAVLEKYYIRYQNEWKQKFLNTKDYLEQNNINYNIENIEVPVLHFDLQTQDEIENKLKNQKSRNSIYKKK